MNVRPIERAAFIIVAAIALSTAAALLTRAFIKSPPAATTGLQDGRADMTAPAAPAFLVESGPDRVGGIDLWVLIHRETQRRYVYAGAVESSRFTLVPLDRKSTSPFVP